MPRKQIAQQLDEIIDFSGVREFIDQPVKNYSSGMYVRLGFAVAIHTDPDILIVDEVLAVGDAAFREKCRLKFLELREQGKTIILVSHSMHTIVEMCDSAVWMQDGHVMSSGEPRDVVAAYEATVAGQE
jgi:ABC-2 type transport system ATP-binding protein